MITKNELEKYRGRKVGEALVKLSVAEGFLWGEKIFQISLSKYTYANASDVIELLDFIKTNLKLQKKASYDEIGYNMSNPGIPFESNSWIDYIDSEYWDTLNSIIL